MINASSLTSPFSSSFSLPGVSSDPMAALANPSTDLSSLAGSLTSPFTGTSASLTGSLDFLGAQGLSFMDTYAVNTLKKPPFAPLNPNMLLPQLYAGASPTAPAAANNKSESQVAFELQMTFARRFGIDTAKTNQGMAVFNDPQIKALVPDARLRSAVASLYGTNAESAITSLKNGDFQGVEFGELPSGMSPTNPAFSGTKVGDSKPTIVFNNRYQYEDPRLLASTLSHEVFHSDAPVAGKEELIARSFDATVYGQFLKEDQLMATRNTELTRTYNSKLMALINSRDAGGKIHILSSQGNVYPGGLVPLDNFAAVDPGALSSPDTPGNAHLNSMLSKLTGQTVTGANFDTNTVNLIDQKINNAFSPSDWVKLANTLQLNTLF